MSTPNTPKPVGYGASGNSPPRRRIRPFNYYGGKAHVLDFVLCVLDPPLAADVYVEVFSGSAVVALNRRPAPLLDVLNDKDRELQNLLAMARDHYDRLVAKILWVPYSRAEYESARSQDPAGMSPLDRAVRYWILLTQCRDGKPMAGWSVNTPRRRKALTKRDRLLADLESIRERICGERVQLECRDWRYMLDTYDSSPDARLPSAPRTLFYLDPPYPWELRNGRSRYVHDFSPDDHRDL